MSKQNVFKDSRIVIDAEFYQKDLPQDSIENA